MLTTAAIYLLLTLALVVVIGMALLPVSLLSGLWAHRSAKAHQDNADEIDRLLAGD